MKHTFLRAFVAVPLLAAASLPAESFHLTQPVQPAHHTYMMNTAKPSPATATTTPRRKVAKRRSKKKSAVIVGGSALGGAAVGGLVGGKKGAAIGALAGGGGGYVYDRKSQQKPVVPK